MGSIPGRGTKIPCLTVWTKKKRGIWNVPASPPPLTDAPGPGHYPPLLRLLQLPPHYLPASVLVPMTNRFIFHIHLRVPEPKLAHCCLLGSKPYRLPMHSEQRPTSLRGPQGPAWWALLPSLACLSPLLPLLTLLHHTGLLAAPGTHQTLPASGPLH